MYSPICSLLWILRVVGVVKLTRQPQPVGVPPRQLRRAISPGDGFMVLPNRKNPNQTVKQCSSQGPSWG